MQQQGLLRSVAIMCIATTLPPFSKRCLGLFLLGNFWGIEWLSLPDDDGGVAASEDADELVQEAAS